MFLALSNWVRNTNVQNSSILQSFTDWLGVPYSILASMILIRVWEKVDEMTTSLDKEALMASTLFDIVQAPHREIKLELRDKIIPGIKDYVRHIQQHYSSEYKNTNQKLLGDQILNDIENIVKSKATINDDQVWASRISSAIDNLITSRKNRFSNFKPLSAYMWTLLLVASLLWLSTFLSVDFQSSFLSYFLIYGIIFIVTTIIVTVSNFNNPSKLEWDDVSGSWLALQKKIDTDK